MRIFEVRGNFGELSECGLEAFNDLKLVRCLRSLAPTLVTLPSMSFIPFTPFSGDDVGIRQIGAIFEGLIFEPEPSRWGASETDGQVERPTERERRSQHVEISVESPAVAAASVTGRTWLALRR